MNLLVNGKTNEECGIKEVYASNLREEFNEIRRIVEKYNYVAMDTEFPGVVARPIGEFKSTADYQYQLLRCNVDLLKLIQVGVTFLDDKGEMPKKFSTWQFNFKFSLGEDMYAQDSIDLLANSGIQFKRHEEDGVDILDFAELLMTSGLVLCDNVKWISFHSGYDFGYLLKLLTNCQLPADENEFFELLQIYFPAIYDVKYVMKSCRSLKGGLQEVADQLKVDRIGPQHQAGSDSLLTGLTFFRMKQLFFEDCLDDSLYRGHLFGLGAPYGNGNGTDAAAPPIPMLDLASKVQQQQQDQQNQQQQQQDAPESMDVDSATSTGGATVAAADAPPGGAAATKTTPPNEELGSSLSSQSSNGQLNSASQDSTDSASETSSNPGGQSFDPEN